MAADGIDECGWATDVQLSCRCPSWGRLAAPALVKLPSRAPSGARALDSFWAAQCALHFHHLVPPFAGIGPAASSARLPRAHGGSMRRQELSWWLLGQRAGNQPAEPAGMAREPPPEVAKCSVMMGGQLMSRRRMFGCSGPKSGSAGSSWRPQLTQISAAPQTMTPVLQDKPRHSTDLAELCSLILWSALFPFRS